MGQVDGIPVKMHITVPIAALLFASMADYPFWLLISILLGLILSLLAHELGHCLVAQSKNGEIEDILLTPIGGLAKIKTDEPFSPKDECQIAVAGPLVSLFLALFF